MAKIILPDGTVTNSKDEIDLLDRGTDVMSSMELMLKANLALANMGRATGALAPAMRAMGNSAERMGKIMKAQVAYFNLQWISKATAEEIREHLRHFKGNIFELESFYIRFGCFPRSCDTERMGADLISAYMWGFKSDIDFDLILMEKSPRLKQGIFFLIMLAIMMLLEAF